MTDDVEVWDFAVPDKPKRFRFNGEEIYEAPALLPPATLRRLATLRTDLNGDDPGARFDQIRDLFAQILVPESAHRFVDRFDSTEDPVDLQRQLLPCLYRLMEAYGLRPTRPSPPLSAGGDITGISSTVGQPQTESTPKPFQHTAGSTSATSES